MMAARIRKNARSPRVLASVALKKPAGFCATRRIWRQISERRAADMRLFVRDLATTGALRPGVDEQIAADIVLSMNSPEYYILLVSSRIGW